MSTIRSNPKELILYLKKKLSHIEPTPGAPFTVACSGGIDSTALLYLLAEIYATENYPPESLRLLYVNHNLRSREELFLEKASIRAHGKHLGVAVHMVTIPRGAIDKACARRGWSIEESARNFRHKIFSNYLEKRGGYLLLAHTEDDQIETLVQRFFQGNGPIGMRGIAFRRDNLLRPLLGVDKKSLESYLIGKGISWSEDSSNGEDRYLRNRMRQYLLPVIEESFPGFRKALLRGRERMEDGVAALKEGVSLPEVRCRREDAGEGEGVRNPSLELAEFLSLNRWYRFMALCKMWNHPDSLGRGELSYQSVLPLLQEQLPPSGRVSTGVQGCWRWEKGELFLEKQVAPYAKKGYFNTVQFPRTALFLKHTLELREGEVSEGALWLPPDVLQSQMVVRSYQDGDAISLRGGRKLIKELFNQWGVPLELRWQIPLLVDKSGIIAVLGRPFGFSDRVAKHMVYKAQYAVIPVVRKE